MYLSKQHHIAIIASSFEKAKEFFLPLLLLLKDSPRRKLGREWSLRDIQTFQAF